MYTVLLIIFLIIILLNFLYIRTNDYKNKISQLEKFKKVPTELEIINLGSSYSRNAFDYNLTNYKGFNFALQPQSLSYDFRILKNYKDNIKKNGIVLIVLPNFVFGFLDYENSSINNRYYYFLKKEYILNYSIIKHKLIKYFPLFFNVRGVLRIIKDVKLLNLEEARSCTTREEVVVEAKNRINGWIKQFNLKNIVNKDDLSLEIREMFKKTQKVLSEIIEYCLENELRPVIIVPPCSKEINDFFSDEYLNEILYNNIKLGNSKNILCLDYLKDKRFQDYRLYINSDMLNKKGREKFTKVVIEDLKNNNYI